MDNGTKYQRCANEAQYNRRKFIALSKECGLPSSYLSQYDRDVHTASVAQGADDWTIAKAFLWPVFLVPIVLMLCVLGVAIWDVLARYSDMLLQHMVK